MIILLVVLILLRRRADHVVVLLYFSIAILALDSTEKSLINCSRIRGTINHERLKVVIKQVVVKSIYRSTIFLLLKALMIYLSREIICVICSCEKKKKKLEKELLNIRYSTRVCLRSSCMHKEDVDQFAKTKYMYMWTMQLILNEQWPLELLSSL